MGNRDLPSGTVTFLFTDVEGSTRLLHALGARATLSEADREAVEREGRAAGFDRAVDELLAVEPVGP